MMIAHAATRVASSRGVGFRELLAADVTVATTRVDAAHVVLVAHDGSWSAVAAFWSGMLLHVRFCANSQDPINGAG